MVAAFDDADYYACEEDGEPLTHWTPEDAICAFVKNGSDGPRAVTVTAYKVAPFTCEAVGTRAYSFDEVARITAPTARDVFVSARAMVARGWEPLAFARTPDGKGCNPYDPNACSWCTLGALLRAGEDVGLPARGPVIVAFTSANEIHAGSIADWNRHQTQEAVLAAFDRAILEAP